MVGGDFNLPSISRHALMAHLGSTDYLKLLIPVDGLNILTFQLRQRILSILKQQALRLPIIREPFK